MTQRILAVDDHAPVRQFLQGALGTEGYRVIPARSGAEALRIFEQEPVDLVVLDVMMPGLDGFEVCRRLKSSDRGRRVPVVMCTALGLPDEIVRGLDAGAEAFLSKPIEVQVLRARIRAILRFRSLLDEAPAGSPDLTALLQERIDRLASAARLSARERQVLDLLLLGRNADEIGRVCAISRRTVKFHQQNLLEKLGADSRADLLRVLLWAQPGASAR